VPSVIASNRCISAASCACRSRVRRHWAPLIWLAPVILYALKWVFARSDALSEARNPIQCCFIGLAGVSAMLVGIAFLPYTRRAREASRLSH
jgi:tellurite resistance protein TehA-like permease